MTPVEVIEDMLRQINVSVWTAPTPKAQAQALLCKLAEFSRFYGHMSMASVAKVDARSLYRFEQGEAGAQLETPLKLLRAIGLRIRIERDPNPRHILSRPYARRAEAAEKFLELAQNDPTGLKRSSALAKEARYKLRKAANQREYRKRNGL